MVIRWSLGRWLICCLFVASWKRCAVTKVVLPTGPLSSLQHPVVGHLGRVEVDTLIFWHFQSANLFNVLMLTLCLGLDHSSKACILIYALSRWCSFRDHTLSVTPKSWRLVGTDEFVLVLEGNQMRLFVGNDCAEVKPLLVAPVFFGTCESSFGSVVRASRIVTSP
jgi:hypothetical protein